MKTLTFLLTLVAASASFGNVLENADFNAPPTLGPGQTDVGVDGAKMIIPSLALVENPDEYYEAISGIPHWIAGSYDGTGVSDHGISRRTSWGDQDDPRLLFINNWERRVSQTTGLVVELGYKYTASVRMYMQLDNPSESKAGLFQLIAGGMDATDPDLLAVGSFSLASAVVGTSGFLGARDFTLNDGAYIDLTLSYTPTAGDAALGKSLTVAMRTEGGSAGPTFWDHASLVAQPVPEPASMAVLGVGVLALAVRRRRQ